MTDELDLEGSVRSPIKGLSQNLSGGTEGKNENLMIAKIQTKNLRNTSLDTYI
jgi:hypothetical protein